MRKARFQAGCVALLLLSGLAEAKTLDFRSPTQIASFRTESKGGVEHWGLTEVILLDGTRHQLGPLKGEGLNPVYCLSGDCRRVIKIAMSAREARGMKQEIADAQKIAKAGIRVAPILPESDPEGLYLVKSFVPGPTLAEMTSKAIASDAVMGEIADMFLKAYDADLNIDIHKDDNLVLGEKGLVLVDAHIRFPDQEVDLKAWMMGLFFRPSNPLRDGHFEMLSTKMQRHLARLRSYEFVEWHAPEFYLCSLAAESAMYIWGRAARLPFHP